MRSLSLGLVLLALALTAPARAGVYNLGESHPLISIEKTRRYVKRMQSASIPKDLVQMRPEEFRFQVLKQIEGLEALQKIGEFSTLDRINLSGAHLRLNQPRQALNVLKDADKTHFLVQSNLAAASFMAGDLRSAVRHQRLALEFWPEVWTEWNNEQIWHFRECERYLLKLYISREETERRNARLREKPQIDLDPLFDGVKYVGADGSYAAGEIAPKMRDKLPERAIPIVFQLSAWFPNDDQLYWQLGELLNAAGQVEEANAIFVELCDKGLSLYRDLHSHRRITAGALPMFRVWRESKTRCELLSFALMLHRPTMAVGVSDAALVYSNAALAEWAKTADPNQDQRPAKLDSPAAAPEIPFNFRHLVVSFFSGGLVSILLMLQWREWRRKRARIAAQEPAPVPTPTPQTAIAPTRRARDVTKPGG